MKLQRISIDGYGRIAGRVLEVHPRLQMVVGPNERGKSTVRSFIGDMLYGQKRSVAQRSYDEAHQLRMPWGNPECYGGALVYRLDQGAEIEVVRNFDKKRESVHVFDRTNANEITDRFRVLRNREVDFAAAHLGVGKDAFLGLATVTHLSLEALGSADALQQIRERLAALADSGDEYSSADSAMARLRSRIMAIGQPSARTKPLPVARQQRVALEHELQRTSQIYNDVAHLLDERRRLRTEIVSFREQSSGLEDQIAAAELHDTAERAAEAAAIEERLGEASAHCEAYADAREFPVHRSAEVQRLDGRVSAARMQRDRSEAEARQIQQSIDEVRAALGAEGQVPIPEELDRRYREVVDRLDASRTSIEDTRALVGIAERRLAEATEFVAAMPDYTRVAPDPVEYVTQLASSFRVAVAAREEETTALETIREEVRKRRKEIAADHALFKDQTDFLDQVRSYMVYRRDSEEYNDYFSGRMSGLRGARNAAAGSIRGFAVIAAACLVFVALAAAAYVRTQQPALAWPAGFGALGFVYGLGNLVAARRRIRDIDRSIAESHDENDRLIERGADATAAIEAMLEESGAATVRELEARYDRYRESSADLSARISVLRQQETRFEEAEQRVPQMLERFRETFEKLGETLPTESDVPDATTRIIANYQEYREAKRRVGDSRAVLEKHTAEVARLEAVLAETETERASIENELRQTLGQEGGTAALDDAIEAYRVRCAEALEWRTRMALMEERANETASRIEREQNLLYAEESELRAVLESGGADSTDAWHEREARARTYQEAWSRRIALEEQLASLLRGESLEAIREKLPEGGEWPERPGESAAQLQAQLEQVQSKLAEAIEEDHTLQIDLTKRTAGVRSVTEVEEELAVVAKRVEVLEAEFEAASFAMAMIDEIARDKHARIAPRLSRRASLYFSEITGGAYDEILVNRDFVVSVRIPQTGRMHEAPERTLSKGTVDQVYLALRLALVECISEKGETIPMLLDDPFANYDDARLTRALRVLQKVSEYNQVLIFTCREDVVRAADGIGASVIRLD